VHTDRGESLLNLPGRFANARVPASVITVLLLAFSATSCGRPPHAESAKFCAMLSDSIGLYVDNPVTQMGYKIGAVKTIEPHDTGVKVGFTIDAKRVMPSDAKAVIRSTSILADRSLELVGNYSGGPQLRAGDCIPPSHTSTPLSISQIIGSATTFANAISPDGSDNLKTALAGIDQATAGNGQKANELLARSSALLDNPDQTIADLGQMTRNVAELTTMLRANREPLKQIVQDMVVTSPDLVKTLQGAEGFEHPLPELLQLTNDLELELGPELQLGLDEASEQLRIWSPHYKGLADMFNFVPRMISGVNGEPPGAIAGGIAKHLNGHVFDLLTWRPPLYRIRTPNGLLACGAMNASLPGSCADIGGMPYAVDTALLQYVLTEAAKK
jgi:phospholipid/cholesterol/gamma-HCH transport system substrate-binding protein